jgi:hypothetical protein
MAEFEAVIAMWLDPADAILRASIRDQVAAIPKRLHHAGTIAMVGNWAREQMEIAAEASD